MNRVVYSGIRLGRALPEGSSKLSLFNWKLNDRVRRATLAGAFPAAPLREHGGFALNPNSVDDSDENGKTHRGPGRLGPVCHLF